MVEPASGEPEDIILKAPAASSADDAARKPRRRRQIPVAALIGLLLVVALGVGWGVYRSTAVDKPDPGATPISEIQAGRTRPNQPVLLGPVGVTAVAYDGFWVQDILYIEQVQRGIWIAAGEGWQAKYPAVRAGVKVSVRGTYVEFDANGAWPHKRSQINLEEGGIRVRGAAKLLPPATVSFPILTRDDVTEPYEGVVVNAVPNMSPRLRVVAAGENGEGVEVTDEVTRLSLGTLIYRPTGLKVDDKLKYVNGIVQYRDGRYVLYPRSEADLVR